MNDLKDKLQSVVAVNKQCAHCQNDLSFHIAISPNNGVKLINKNQQRI